MLRRVLKDLANAKQNKEMRLSQCTEEVKNLVDQGIGFIECGELEKAVNCFYKVIELEPAYARARMQIVDIHKQHKNHVMALLECGAALAYAKDPTTISQIFCLAADSVIDASRKHKDDQEASEAIHLYENAIEADNRNPVPRWNLCEVLYLRNDIKRCKTHLNGLIECVRRSGGKYRAFVDQIIADARVCFQGNNLWVDYLRRLEAANHILIEEHDHTNQMLQTRHGVLAYTLAAVIAGTGILGPGIVTDKNQDAAQLDVVRSEAVPVLTDQEDEVLSQGGLVLDTNIKVSRVDYSPKDLKIARLDYSPRDLT